VVEPVETTISFFPHCGRFDASTGSATTRSTTAFHPFSLAFSCGHFDASTSSAATGSMIVSANSNGDFI